MASGAVLARKIASGSARSIAKWLGWPAVASAFFGVPILLAVIDERWVQAGIVLGVQLAVTAPIMLLRFGPERIEHAAPARVQPAIRFVRKYPWRTLTTIFFLTTITLLALNLASSSPGRPSEQITFVVSLDDTELLVFRDILDDLEPELDAQVFLMNVDSSRYVARLDKMRASENMKWDLIAVDNNMLGVLAAKDLVEVLSDELVPPSLVPSLRPLLECGDELCFAPFRANVKIAYYNEEKFAEYGLKPPTNWDQLLEVAKVFKEEEGVGRVAIQGYPGPATAVTVFEFIRAAGGDPLTLDDDRSREAFEFLQELEPYLAPEYVETRFDTANELLIDDQIYLVDNWTFGLKVVIEEAEKAEIKVYSGWNGRGGEVHVLGGDVLGVPKGAPHADKAIKLIELLLSKETQQTMLSRLRWMPARLDAYDVPSEQRLNFQAVNEALSLSEARPTEPQWTLAENILDDAFGVLVREGKSIDVWLEVYSRRLEAIPELISYTAKDGDTLEKIADRYETTPALLAEVNRMTSGTSVGPGQILLVPRQ